MKTQGEMPKMDFSPADKIGTGDEELIFPSCNNSNTSLCLSSGFCYYYFLSFSRFLLSFCGKRWIGCSEIIGLISTYPKDEEEGERDNYKTHRTN